MGISQRIEGTMEYWRKLWGQALNNFLVGILSLGLDTFFKVLGKSFAPKLAPFISRIEATGQVPEELKPLLAELKSPTGEVSALLGESLAGAAVTGVIERVLNPILTPLANQLNYQTGQTLNSLAELLSLYLRNIIDYSTLETRARYLGYSPGKVTEFVRLSKTIYSVTEAVNLFRRGKISGTELTTNLTSLGYDAEHMQGLLELAIVTPPVQDIIRMAVREAYSPEIAGAFGQYQDFPEKAMPDAEKVGLNRDTFTKYWAAHWDLPSPQQGFEMLHRKIISPETLSLLLRALDIMPYWRDNLIKMSYSPFTRVDARRMWDLGCLNDEELKKSYTDIGYDEEHAQRMVVWTKVYQTFPDIIARYKNGYINVEQVRSELSDLGLDAERTEFLMQTKIKAASADRLAKERDLTKADIIKGVKKGVISTVEATEFLIDLGYDKFEADFIIQINAPAEDTITGQAMKQLTKTDIINSLKKAVITEEEALSRLMIIRYTEADARFIVNLALASITPIGVIKDRELTKTDIVKGVKTGVITPEEAYMMLQDIGYDPGESAFILAISQPTTTGSPDSYSDFKKITQAFKASQGQEAKPVPQELQAAEYELKAADAALRLVKERHQPEEVIISLTQTVARLTTQYRTLLKKYRED